MAQITLDPCIPLALWVPLVLVAGGLLIWYATASRGRLPFQPFPDRGHKPPPLDLSNPEFSVGVWNYVTLAGNNGPADGPANNDGSASGEVRNHAGDAAPCAAQLL